jgi:hypothetical protein
VRWADTTEVSANGQPHAVHCIVAPHGTSRVISQIKDTSYSEA